MKHAAIIVMLLLTAIYTKAQTQNFGNNVSAQTTDLTDIKGSAYSSADWAKATVIMEDKTTYANLKAKYSEYEDKLVVEGKDGQVMEFNNKVNDFTLSFVESGKDILSHYRNAYNVEGYSPKAFFEILADGKTQLLKKVSKKVQTKTEYGAVSSNRSFVTTTRYFVVSPAKSTLIKKDSKSILAALNNKTPELESYIKEQKLNLSKEEDMVKLLTYYNSINI